MIQINNLAYSEINTQHKYLLGKHKKHYMYYLMFWLYAVSTCVFSLAFVNNNNNNNCTKFSKLFSNMNTQALRPSAQSRWVLSPLWRHGHRQPATTTTGRGSVPSVPTSVFTIHFYMDGKPRTRQGQWRRSLSSTCLLYTSRCV